MTGAGESQKRFCHQLSLSEHPSHLNHACAGDQTLRLWDVFPSDKASFANGRLLNHIRDQLR